MTSFLGLTGKKSIWTTFLGALIIASGIGLAVDGCKSSGGGGTPPHISFAYISPSVPPGVPLANATGVPLFAVITGTTSSAKDLPILPANFTLTITDSNGTAVAGSVQFPDSGSSGSNSSVLFLPASHLAPDTTYTLTATDGKYSTSLSFATGSVSANPVVLGQGLSVVIPAGSMTQPPGLGAIIESQLQGLNILFSAVDKQQTSTSGTEIGFIQFAGGQGTGFVPATTAPNSAVFPLAGSYFGQYAQSGGALTLNVAGLSLPIDSFSINGTFVPMTGGVGLTDGTIVAIINCAAVTDPTIAGVIGTFCNNNGQLDSVGSFYATPVALATPKDLSGNTVTATITYPTEFEAGVGITPPANTIRADIGQGGTTADLTVNNATVMMTLRDTTTPGSLVSGTMLTVTSGTPITGNGRIAGATFTPLANLTSGHTYKDLAIVNLQKLTGTTFTAN